MTGSRISRTIYGMEEGYSIRTVAQLTGLSDHVIRAWERRYGAVKPARTEGNQRIYSETEINRLRLLGQAVAAGNPISRLAGLPDEALEEVLSLTRGADGEPRGPKKYVAEALDAVRHLDPTALEEVLARAFIELGQIRAIDALIMPMMDEIGKHWHAGQLRIMHEHMASAVVRSVLGSAFRARETSLQDKGVVVASPSGQPHDLGALACAVTAASLGFRVTYLGGGMPAVEIAAAAAQTGSVAVIVSVVFPHSVARVREDVHLLQRYLPRDVRLIVGGASASQIDPRYGSRSMSDFREELAALRTGPA